MMQTGSLRKPSRLVFAGAVWDAGLRRWGRVGPLCVSSWSGGSWNRVLSHLDPYQYLNVTSHAADNAQLCGRPMPLPGVQEHSSHALYGHNRNPGSGGPRELLYSFL